MPAPGRLELAAALRDAPELKGLDTEPWELPGARVVQASFEVAHDPAEEAIPPALHPSIPPYATFTVAEFPESPAGSFHLAQVRIIARAGIRPRGFLVGAVCDSEAASAELASRWGYRIRPGEVSLTVRHDRWSGRVKCDGAVVMEVSCRDPQVIGGAEINLVDNLNLAAYEGGGVLVQVDPEYLFHAANRGQAELSAFDPARWGSLGTAGKVQPTTPNVAVSCRVDTDLPQIRFVIDPAKRAIEGTRRLR